MRKIVDKIEISIEDVNKYIKLSIDSTSAESMLNSILNNTQSNANESTLSSIADKVLDRIAKASKESEEFRLYLVNTYIKPEYRSDEYSWNIDTGRNILEISKDE